MKPIQIESEVGGDGVLDLRVPLGESEANARVLVTIEPAVSPNHSRTDSEQDWHEFVQRTYGSCVGLGLEEPDDLPLQQRDWSR